MIRKKLQRLGNSTALVLDQGLLDILGAREGSVVSLSATASGALIVRASDEEPQARGEREQAVSRMVRKVMERDPFRVFKPLAPVAKAKAK